MSFTLSELCLQRLSTCHADLSKLVLEVSKVFPCVVLCCYRNEAEQGLAVQTGHSKTPWPHSKHNTVPSQAVDLAPAPYDPKDKTRILLFAGTVLGIASCLKIPLRWGGDFNENLILDDKFVDMYHFELREPH